MDKDIEKYAAAKTILGFNLLANRAKRADGTVDKAKLDELLKEKYENIRESIMKRKEESPDLSEKLDHDLQEIGYLYSLIKDEDSRKEYDVLTKQEVYAKNLPLNPEEVKTGIIRNFNYKYSKERWYQFEVSPNGENTKQILVIPKRNYQYTTQLGVIAYLNEYEIVKNIAGIDMHFDVTTNTRFDEVDRIIHLDRPLSDKEKEYISLFNKQMSDLHLRTCQRKFNGYIGTVENNLNGTIFDMNDEDLATTKLIRQKEQDLER